MADMETTDITLFVKTSGEEIARWSRQRIVDALIRETDVDIEAAEAISKEVEKQIISSGISLLTAPLIRELVDAKLIERGLEQARRKHAILGFPVNDVRNLILHQNKGNANVPHGPEGTNLLLAEGIKRDFAFYDVFSTDIADAHAIGDIHIHGLGFVDRPYSSLQSLEYIKRFGLNLPHSLTVAKPAKHAEVLLAHMVRFGAILQANFAGVIGWDSVNFSFAPYLSGMDDKEIRQFSQMLIYEFSQLTSARGGQSMFTDIHLYWETPAHLRGVPAVGPEGAYTGGVYEDYITDARRFVMAIFEVFRKGDGAEKPFIFPRPIMHLTEAFFQDAHHEELLDHLCDVALEKGNTCFYFDRDGEVEPGNSPPEESTTPWTSRSFSIQNVTMNLPRLGYKCAKDDGRLFSLISEQMELVAKAHIQKRDFIQKLLSYGDEGPLAMLAMNKDGFPYLRMDHATYLMGVVGLNELVHIHMGKQLHESEKALEFGMEVVTRMREETERLRRKYDLQFVLEQTPAETTSYRFARLDLKYFSPEAGHIVKGNLSRGEIYYTNSTHLAVSAPVDPMVRIMREGRFHPLIDGDAMTHIWLSDLPSDKGNAAKIVAEAFRNTLTRQIIFAPEFAICRACKNFSRGLKDVCPSCGATDLEKIARITQYFSNIASWNKGKLAELRDRNRYTI